MKALFPLVVLLAIAATGHADAPATPAGPTIIVELPGPDPAEIQARFKKALDKVRNQVVGLNIGGEASGALISEDGLIITAAHVLMDKAPEATANILLEDGRKLKAEQLGCDIEIDFALLRITPKPEEPLPHCTLAAATPLPGAYCFVLAHPSGKSEGRPAQPRLGRILNISPRDGQPWIGQMDCEIQPGDSGGPVFDLDGNLIGVASSASGYKRFNRFATISQFHANREFLLTPGNKRGTKENGLAGTMGQGKPFSVAEIRTIQKLMDRRIREQHQQSIQFSRIRRDAKGVATIKSSDLINFYFLDAFPLIENRPFSYGLDDPALVNPYITKLAAPSAARLRLWIGETESVFALRVDQTLAVASNSMIPSGTEDRLAILTGKGNRHPAKLVQRLPEKDLALLEIPGEIDGPTVDFLHACKDSAAGDLLLAVDSSSCVVLGNVMDQPREIKTPDSQGPIGKEIHLSKRRGPFPPVVNHSVPLYAEDAGTPVFTLDGRFAGMHLARSTRTYGVLVTPADLETVVREWLSKSK